MTTAAICRTVGGALVILIGAALGFGDMQLWRAGPAIWPDVVANEVTVRRTSGGMIVMAAILLIAGVATIGNVPWAAHAAASATIVLVVAASAHRHAAFEAANFLMDYLKSRAPFWKKEHLVDGSEGGWVEAKEADDKAAGRWTKSGE